MAVLLAEPLDEGPFLKLRHHLLLFDFRRGEQLRSFDAAGVRADDALLRMTMSQFEGDEDIVEYDILI